MLQRARGPHKHGAATTPRGAASPDSQPSWPAPIRSGTSNPATESPPWRSASLALTSQAMTARPPEAACPHPELGNLIGWLRPCERSTVHADSSFLPRLVCSALMTPACRWSLAALSVSSSLTRRSSVSSVTDGVSASRTCESLQPVKVPSACIFRARIPLIVLRTREVRTGSRSPHPGRCC